MIFACYSLYRALLLTSEESNMAEMVNVNFKINAEDKRMMEKACEDMGLSMSSAFVIYAKKVGREKRIPFEINVDPFYNISNIEHLKRGIKALNEGKGVEHEIIEE